MAQQSLKVSCTNCGGDGEYETTHPSWGSPSCPEAYVLVECSNCGGSGEVDFEVPEELLDLAIEAFWNEEGNTVKGMRAALAAVIQQLQKEAA